MFAFRVSCIVSLYQLSDNQLCQGRKQECHLFHDKFSLRQGDMNRVFKAMLDGAPEWFAAGYRIETPIGTFSPKLKLKRQVTDTDDISHDDVELDGIEFQPSKSFIKNMEYAVVRDGFRYVRKPQSNRLLNNQQHPPIISLICNFIWL